MILPEYHESLLPYLSCARSGEEVTTEFTNLYEDGNTYEWQAWASPVRRENGSVSGICISLLDITRRKQDEQKLKAALREKEVLLKEIHHRVKNNLQIISSLLRLQGNQIQEPQALQALRDSQQRVRSMALIHEMLYKSGNLSQVDFSEYLKNLAIQLLKTYRKGKVSFRQTAPAGLWLDLDQAIPCGLILSELVTNALKYAFPEEYKGEASITVEIETDRANDDLRLVVADNGVGFPVGFEPGKVETLGYQLVEMLSRQLEGELKIDSSPDKGTRVELSFMVKNQRTL